MRKRLFNAVVLERRDISPGNMILRVASEGAPLPDFVPGQFAVIGLPGSAPRCPGSDPEEPPAAPDKIIPRAYSIASSSCAKEYLEFYIVLVHSGALTPRLFMAKPGDPIWLSSKINGYFTLEEVPPEAHIAMVATGTGLAPYMSMIRSYVEHHPDRRLAIIHGARHAIDLGYREELEELERNNTNFCYVPVISRPEEEPELWPGEQGYVQDVWERKVLYETWGLRPCPLDTHVFLCGNPGMVDAMERLLLDEGFREHQSKSPGQIHVERYW